MTSLAGDAGTPGPRASARPGVWLAEVAVVAMALVWGVNYSVIKYGTGVVEPLAYNAVRVSLGAVCLLSIAALWGGVAPGRRDVLMLLALGALGNGVYQIFFAEGIARTRAGEAALVVGGSPALMALIGRAAGVERVAARGVVGIALSISGVGLVVLGRAASGAGAPGGSLGGDLLVLCGSICWAVYTILLIPYTRRLSGWYVLAISMAGGSVVLLTAGAPAIAAVNWPSVPGAAWAAIAYGSLGALVFAYVCWYRGVKVLGPTRTALYGNLQPIIALVVAWITLRETPTAWQALGAVTIVGGVLLTRMPATEPS
jgi:drug/metabolite transporter (DMT)-like permease